MLTWKNTDEPGVSYGLGVRRVDYAALGIDGIGSIIGHDGFPGSFMYYWPEQEVTVVGTINQAAPEMHQVPLLIAEILKQVKLQLNS